MSQHPNPIHASSYRCVHCGYDLSGSAVGGVCPECGSPVSDTLRVSTRQTGATSTNAILSMVLGIIGVTACGFVAPFAIWLYYKAKEDVQTGVAAPSSMGMAKAGLILGWIGTILTVGVIIFYAILFAVII